MTTNKKKVKPSVKDENKTIIWECPECGNKNKDIVEGKKGQKALECVNCGLTSTTAWKPKFREDITSKVGINGTFIKAVIDEQPSLIAIIYSEYGIPVIQVEQYDNEEIRDNDLKDLKKDMKKDITKREKIKMKVNACAQADLRRRELKDMPEISRILHEFL